MKQSILNLLLCSFFSISSVFCVEPDESKGIKEVSEKASETKPDEKDSKDSPLSDENSKGLDIKPAKKTEGFTSSDVFSLACMIFTVAIMFYLPYENDRLSKKNSILQGEIEVASIKLEQKQRKIESENKSYKEMLSYYRNNEIRLAVVSFGKMCKKDDSSLVYVSSRLTLNKQGEIQKVLDNGEPQDLENGDFIGIDGPGGILGSLQGRFFVVVKTRHPAPWKNPPAEPFYFHTQLVLVPKESPNQTHTADTATQTLEPEPDEIHCPR